MKTIVLVSCFASFAVLFSSVSKADRILVLGDSHTCGDFGRNLATELSEGAEHDVTVFCAPGLSSQHWVKGFKPKNPANNCKTFTNANLQQSKCLGSGEVPELKSIIDTKPGFDRIVVALGSNNLGLNGLNSFGQVVGIIKSSGAECHWVGPPSLGENGSICRQYGGNLTKVIDSIKASSEGICSFHDSRKYTTSDTTPDCIHRFGKPARDWATGIHRDLNIPSKKRSASKPPPRGTN